MSAHKDLFDDLEGFFAYDSGATDSGTHDSVRRARRAAELDALNPTENPGGRAALSRWVRDAYLSDEALTSGHGWEDALAFLKWIDDGNYRG